MVLDDARHRRLFESQKGIAQILRTERSNDAKHAGILSWLIYDDLLFSKTEQLVELSKFLQRKALPKDYDYRDWSLNELSTENDLETLNTLKQLIDQDKSDIWFRILEKLPGIELSLYEQISRNIQQGKVKLTDAELNEVLKRCQPFLDINHLIQRRELHRIKLDPDNQDVQHQNLLATPNKLTFIHQTLKLTLSDQNLKDIRTWFQENLQHLLLIKKIWFCN